MIDNLIVSLEHHAARDEIGVIRIWRGLHSIAITGCVQAPKSPEEWTRIDSAKKNNLNHICMKPFSYCELDAGTAAPYKNWKFCHSSESYFEIWDKLCLVWENPCMELSGGTNECRHKYSVAHAIDIIIGSLSSWLFVRQVRVKFVCKNTKNFSLFFGK